MLRSLLVGVNGSEWSQQAVKLGVEWARNLKIPVTFLGVVDVDALTAVEPVPLGAVSFKADRDVKVVEAACRKVDAALQDAAQVAADAGVQYRTKHVQGNPAIELGREVQRHDLLLIGRRHIPETDRDPPASATMTDILRHGARPVVVASRDVPSASPVVIAYDGSSQAARTLANFVASGLYYGHPLHLVGVSDDPAHIQDVLGRATDYLAQHGQQATIHVLPVGRGVAKTLSDFARNLPAGLMVMGVHGQPRLKELLFGSVTRAVLNAVPAPLFLDH